MEPIRILAVLLVVLTVRCNAVVHRRHGHHSGSHGNDGGDYGNETVIDSARSTDEHYIRIVLPDHGFMTADVDDDFNEVETTVVATENEDVNDLRHSESPAPPDHIEAYRMSAGRAQWTQAQVRWRLVQGCATGYRIRYIAELGLEEAGLESFRAMSDIVRVRGGVDWVDLSAAGRILAVSIATECNDRYGPYSRAYEIKSPAEHPDRVEIEEIRSRSTTSLEVALTCRARDPRGLKFLVMAHRLNRAGQRKPGATKTWSFPGIEGPIFNLTSLRPRSKYEIEVRMERYTRHGDRYGPWSGRVQADTLNSKHDQLVLVRNTAVPVRMYGPPMNLSHSTPLKFGTVNLYWRPPMGTGPCMALPSTYRVTYGPVTPHNMIPERVRDVKVSMRLLPRASFRLKRHDVSYRFQVVALNRDGIPSLWASNLDVQEPPDIEIPR